MSKELVIGSNRHETKVGILEDDQLVEVYFQRANEYSLAGSIHKGRVTRVLPGMQSAFVDLGLERDTFLYVSDFFEEHEDIDTVADEKPSRGERRDRGHRERGGERQVEEREMRAPVIEIAPPEVAEVGEGEEGVPAAGVATESNASPEGDRGFRGDRRGRRSRRRRQRGRGFPENKYAQPGDLSARPPEAVAAPTEEEEESAPEDVIILPGESLAKYRNVSAAADAPEESEEPAVQ